MGLASPGLNCKIHPTLTDVPAFRMRWITPNSWLGMGWFTLKSCVSLTSLTPALRWPV